MQLQREASDADRDLGDLRDRLAESNSAEAAAAAAAAAASKAKADAEARAAAREWREERVAVDYYAERMLESVGRVGPSKPMSDAYGLISITAESAI